MDFEMGTGIDDGNLEMSTDIELRVGNGTITEGSVEKSSQVAHNDQVAPDFSGAELTLNEGDEPYIGQEFESEVAAQEFYGTYGQKMGFNIRVSSLSRSKRDGTLTSRTLVCNKEGYRVADKRSRTNVRQRVPTRVGCKAMVSVKKLNSGRWVINKFVKEHNHALTPETYSSGLIYDQAPPPNEDAKVKELTKQLMVEKKRSASLKRIIDLLFNHIENHAEHLSEKVQCIVDNVKDVESEGKGSQKTR